MTPRPNPFKLRQENMLEAQLMLQKTTDFLTQQWLLTIALIAISTVVPLCDWVGYILIALLILRSSYGPSLLGLLAYILPAALLAFWQTGTMPWTTIISPVFVALTALTLRRYQTWAAVIDFSFACTLLVTAALFFIFPHLQQYWLSLVYWLCDTTTTFIQNNNLLWQQLSPLPNSHIDSTAMGNWRLFTDYLREINFFTYFPMVATSLLIVCMQLSLLANTWLASKLGNTHYDLHTLRLSRASTLAMTLVLIAVNQKELLALQLIIGLTLWYFFAGLSFCHWLSRYLPKALGWLWIVALYLWLTIAPKSAIITIIFIAFIDSLINARVSLPHVARASVATPGNKPRDP